MPTLAALAALICALILIAAIHARKRPRPDAPPEQKGADGEERVAQTLADLLPPESVILRNLLIPKPDRTTSEIDLLAITSNGLLLVESKNLAGWIFGDTASEHWTQTLPTRAGHAEKYPFLNPIRQNAAHLRHLRRHLAEHGHRPPIHPIIVFAGTAHLKSTPPYAPGHAITTIRHLTHVIAAILATPPETLRPEDIAAIAQTLAPAANATPEDRARHIAQTQAQAATPRCPRCGAILIQRTATKGPNAGQTFLACPRYPHCRHTQPLADDTAQ